MRAWGMIAGLAGLAGLAGAMPAMTQQPGAAPAPKLAAGAQTQAAARVPAVANGAKPLTRDDVDAWLDGFMPFALQRGDIAGAVVVVVKDGAVLTQRGFGYADVASRKPVDPEATMFRPGSISKLFTWTAVMQLVEQGKLDLDADVNTYLDFKIPPRGGDPITLRNIMTHTAGFEEAPKGLISRDPKANKPLGDVLKRWTPTRIFAPGTTPAYSNYATGLAGYVVERVSGMPFDVYIDRNIFGRLGMARSSFHQPLPASLQPLMAKGYGVGSGGTNSYEFINPAPAGALASTGADMAKFMIAHLENGGPLLKPETTHLMHDTKLAMLPPLNRMALGFYEQNLNGRQAIGHGGATREFRSNLSLFPDEKVGLYISMNSAGRDNGTALILKALFEQFADRYFPAPDTDGRVDPKIAAEHAKMMVGTYLSSRRSDSSFLRAGELTGQFKIKLDGKGGLLIPSRTELGGATRKWVEIAPFVWRHVNGHERLAAKVVDGKVVRVGFDGASPYTVYEPAPWYRSSAWIWPLLLASLGALALTAFAWPAAALIRWHYGVKPPLAGSDLKAYRLVGGLAAGAVIVLFGWNKLIEMMSDITNLNGRLDPLILLLQCAGAIMFFGLLAVALWNVRLVWSGNRGWLSKLWSLVIVLAAFVTLWAALVFNLIDFGTSY